MAFDVRLHPNGLSDPDLESLRLFGVTHVLAVPALEKGADAKAILAHFDALLGRQLGRLGRFGLTAFAALGVGAPFLPRRGLQEVLAALPGYLGQPGVRVIGALSLAPRKKEQEKAATPDEDAMKEQLRLAKRFGRPALVSAPAQGKEQVTRATLNLLRKSGLSPTRVLVDGVSERTVRTVRELGYWAGLTLHPDHARAEDAPKLVRALGPERLVLSSGAGEGACDLLGLPRAAHLMEKAGLSEKVVAKVTFDNASNWLSLEAP